MQGESYLSTREYLSIHCPEYEFGRTRADEYELYNTHTRIAASLLLTHSIAHHTRIAASLLLTHSIAHHCPMTLTQEYCTSTHHGRDTPPTAYAKLLPPSCGHHHHQQHHLSPPTAHC